MGNITDWDAFFASKAASPTTAPISRRCYPTAAELPELVASFAGSVTGSSGGDRLLVAGHGSKLDWGPRVHQPTVLVSTQHLDRLIDHAVGDLTVTVEAGMSFQALQAQLAQANQFLPLDPLFADRATIGGIIATADTGSLRHRYGGVRDLVLGVQWVRADGQVAKAGGRVVKNVAGYDLMKLFTGSYGTLGILQQVSLRVYPLPPATGSVWVTGSDVALGEIARRWPLLSLTPTAVDVLSPALATKLELGPNAGILARFQTIPASITAQGNQLSQLAQSLGATATALDADRSLALADRARTAVSQSPIFAKVGLRASQVPQLLDRLASQAGLGLIHLGSGIGWVGLDRGDEILALRDFCQASGGYLSVLTVPDSWPEGVDHWGIPAGVRQLQGQLRQRFDPDRRFNPGKFSFSVP